MGICCISSLVLFSMHKPRIFLKRHSTISELRFAQGTFIVSVFCIGVCNTLLCSSKYSPVLAILLSISAMIVCSVLGSYLNCSEVRLWHPEIILFLILIALFTCLCELLLDLHWYVCYCPC